MFRLTLGEKNEPVTNCHRFETLKHSTFFPFAFTEHGVAMLSSVLKSERAVKISIHIIDAFIRLREFIVTHKELTYKLKELEQKIGKHDKEIKSIVEVIQQLITKPDKPKRKMGFHT